MERCPRKGRSVKPVFCLMQCDPTEEHAFYPRPRATDAVYSVRRDYSREGGDTEPLGRCRGPTGANEQWRRNLSIRLPVARTPRSVLRWLKPPVPDGRPSSSPTGSRSVGVFHRLMLRVCKRRYARNQPGPRAPERGRLSIELDT